MQRQRFLFAALLAVFFGGLAVPAAALAWGEVFSVPTDLNLRSKRSPTAEIVTTIKAGTRIRADFREGDWVAVFPLEQKDPDLAKALGFANAKFLLSGPIVEASAAPEPLEKTPATIPAAAPKEQAAASEKAASPRNASPSGSAASIPVVQAKAVNAAPQPVPPALAPEPPAAPQPAPAEGVTVKVEQASDTAPPAASSAGQPVRVTADRLVYNERQGTVTFEGDVHVDHAGMQLTSLKVTAYLTDRAEARKDGRQIDHIVAEGNVVVTKDDARGTCSILTYFVQDGVLRMEGDPVLQQGSNTVAGRVIKFYLKDNRSEILSGGGRQVEAVFDLPEGMSDR